MRKLIFFDIDGTLVTEHTDTRIIPDSTHDAIRRLRESGHLCFINTGRAFSEIDQPILNLQMDGLVCGCGTYILYHDETLLSHTIPLELGNRILSDLKQCQLEWLLESTHSVYYSTEPYVTRIKNFQKEHQAMFPQTFHTIEPASAKDLVFDKFCVCIKPGSNMSCFMDIYQNDLDFIDRGNGFYEIVPVGYSKASGIQFLMEYFDIPQADTIAIGDSTNDLPMLEYAATSIAMGGSQKVVCDASTFVTDTILEDGLRNAFCRLNLI